MRFLLPAFLLFIISTSHAQSIDSLKIALHKSKNDSAATQLRMEISSLYANTNLDSAFLYARKAEANMKHISLTQQSLIYRLFGMLYSVRGRYELTLDYYLKRSRLVEKHNIVSHLVPAYLQLANTFEQLGDNDNALLYFKKALAEAKQQKDTLLINDALNYVATFYFNRKNFEQSLLLWRERLLYNPALRNDVSYIAGIGDLYRYNKQYLKAGEWYEKAIRVATEKGRTENLSMLYSNYAMIPYDEGDYKLAIDYYEKAKAVSRSLNQANEVNNINGSIANALAEDEDYLSALPYLDTAISFYRSNKQIRELARLLDLRSTVLMNLGDYKGAYEAKVQATQLEKELRNTETEKKLSDLMSSIKEEKKDREMQETLKGETLRKKILLGIILIFVIISLIIFRNTRIVTAQKKEVEKQKRLVEENRTELIESIHYARYVQEAILPSKAFIDAHLPATFLIYSPKDIVAGDFYWCEQKNNTTFMAVADSTGHGVPGALVSVVCSNALHRAVNEFNITDPGAILDKARELILETFGKSGNAVKDGMDISLLSINKNTRSILWSGANNPLWYVQNQELKEIKADKQPVGRTEFPKPFTTHSITYQEDTTFYLFTDGLPDQFGGPKGKKFKYKPFADLLLQQAHLPLHEQADHIAAAFSTWKGTLDQVDDVCVMGVRI